MELPLDRELIGALRRSEARTLSNDARRVELAVQAMSAAGGQWVTVKSQDWWLRAFDEATDLYPEDYECGMELAEGFSDSSYAYAQSFDCESTHLHSYPDPEALESLRRERCAPR